jgi:hypothetical protein
MIALFVQTAIGGTNPRAPRGDARFPTAIQGQLDGKTVRMILTGTAMRRKYGLAVYAIGSYVEEGAAVGSADALARASVTKQLQLIFERDVDGATMASSFRESIGMNHPAPAFAKELDHLERFFRANPVKRGDHIRLSHIPGTGLTCQLVGKPPLIIPNMAFAQAAWDVYLGPRNLGSGIKAGLAARL